MNRNPAGVTATKNRGSLWLADTDGRLFEHHFGPDAAASLKNWDDGTTTAAVTGAPTYGAANIDLNGNAATPKGVNFNEFLGLTDDFLQVILMTKPSASGQFFYSIGPDGGGNSLRTGLQGSGTLIQVLNGQVGVSNPAQLNWPTMTTEYVVVFGWGRYGDFARAQYCSGGALSAIATGSTAPATTYGRAIAATAPFQLAINGGGAGNFKAGFAAAFNQVKDAAWRLETALRIKKQATARGLVVL